MSLGDTFRRGRKIGEAARNGRPPLPPPPDHPGGGKPPPIKFGYYCPLNSENPGGPNYFYGERAIVLFGLNGAGKSTRLLIRTAHDLVWKVDIRFRH